MEENREIEIDLRKIFIMLKKKVAIILVIAFIMGMQFLIIFSYHLYLLQFVKLIGSLWS